jgi:hypothetical protein
VSHLNDKDSLNDRINVTMRIRKPSDSLVLSNMNIVIGLDYVTSGVVQMQMETLAIVQIEGGSFAGNSISKIKTLGTLALK